MRVYAIAKAVKGSSDRVLRARQQSLMRIQSTSQAVKNLHWPPRSPIEISDVVLYLLGLLDTFRPKDTLSVAVGVRYQPPAWKLHLRSGHDGTK